MLGRYLKHKKCVVRHKGQVVKIRCYRNDHITKTLARGSFYEQDFLCYVAEHVPKQSAIIDVGAFVGNHSLYFAKFCQPHSVIAFEPFPETFELLEQNVRKNGERNNIECRNKAVGDACSTVGMTVADELNAGMNRVSDSGGTKVAMVTLDSELSELSHKIGFVKIDAEGCGGRVIAGARSILRAHRPLVAIEVPPEPLESIDELMFALDYKRSVCFNATPTYFYEPA